MNPFHKAVRFGKLKLSRNGEMDPKRKSDSKPHSLAAKITSIVLAAAMVFQTSGVTAVHAEEKDPNTKAAAVETITADPYGSDMTVNPDHIGEVLTAKHVTAKGNDKFNVTLSALSSTSNEESTVVQPMDIVMVLDVSGSMAYNFKGQYNRGGGYSDKWWYPESEQRITSLKSSATAFVNSVAEQNKTIENDSDKINVSVITYASSASTKQNLTSNTNAVISTINGLSTGGATQADLGLQYAVSQFNQHGREGARRVVIFFTDGQPTSGNSFENKVANAAVKAAASLKAGGAEVYSIGIFDGANADGNVESTDKNSNRFMQAVSSNYPNADSYTGTLGAKDPNGSYYLTASTSAGLKKVFEDIFKSMFSEMLYPTEADKDNPDSSGYVTLKDTLGDWMSVQSGTVKIHYGNTEYDLGSKAEVDNNVIAGGKGNISSIQVSVTSGTGSAGDTIEVKIPASLLPLVYYQKKADGTTEIISAEPLAVTYDVALKPAMRNLLNETRFDAEAASWVSAHTESGLVSFLSNAYESGENGTTTAEFTPNSLSLAYRDGDGNKKEFTPEAKDPNRTNTAANAEAAAWNGNSVVQHLGNNGRISYIINSGLEISKTVEVEPAGQKAPDQAFTFTVSLSDPDGKPIDGTYSGFSNKDGGFEITFTDGKATLSLKDGETASIKNLPILASYKVEETELPGFTADQKVLTGTIAANQTQGADFTNTYTWTPLVLDSAKTGLEGTKVLEGRDWQDDDAFTFTLSAQAETPLPETSSVTVTGKDADKTFKFGEITYTEPGTYIYTLSERSAEGMNIPGVTNSQEIYQITVTVKDNGDGTLSAETPVVKIIQNISGGSTSEDASSIQFTNRFNADETEFPAQFYKILRNGEPAGMSLNDLQFSFEMSPSSKTPDAPMPADAVNGKSVVQNSGSMIQFPGIPLKASDVGHTYWYDVHEVIPAEADRIPGMAYAENFEYEIKVTVGTKTGTDGKQIVTYEATTYFEGEPEKDLTMLQFVNEMSVQPAVLTAQTGPQVYKTLQGRAINENEFSFILTPTDGTKKAVEDGKVVLDSVTASAPAVDNGQISIASFGNMTFKAVGIYTFEITEDSSKAIPGVTFDDSVHRITVEVTLPEGTDELHAEVIYEESVDQLADGVVFENIYTASETDPVVVSASKEFAAAEGFEVPADAGFNILVKYNDREYENVVVRGGQTVDVLNRSYDKAGTYVYTVSEIQRASGIEDSSVTYDPTVYTVTVTVTDPGTGKLEAETKITKGEGDSSEPADAIAFSNRYNPEPIKDIEVDPYPRKVLTGREEELKGGEFQFEIKLTGNPADGAKYNGTSSIVSNEADGSIPAGSVSFYKPGKYTLSVTEVEPADDSKVPGVTYDKHTANWVYEVKDVNGQLKYTVSQPADFTFSNSYQGTGELDGADNLVVSKTLKGRPNDEWASGDKFEFVLSASGEETIKAVEDGTVVLPEKSTIEATADNQSPAFGNIRFTKPGTYEFQVSEVQGSIAGVTYDTSVKTIVVNVTDNSDGTLSAVLGEGSEPLEFANSYSTKEVEFNTNEKAEISKEYSGKEWSSEAFSFSLSQTAGPDGATIANDSVTLTKDQPKAGFGVIKFTKSGKYVFEIKENAGEQLAGGSTLYDSHTLTLTVDVTDNGKGELEANGQVTGDLVFKNVFTPNPVRVSLSGEKVLEGRDFLDTDSFTFTAEAQDGAPAVGEAAARNGSISFAPVNFDAPGTYTYLIKEVKGDIPGITYSNQTVKAVVTVSQDAESGALSATVTYDGNSSFVITNVYNAKPVSALAGLTGYKQVESSSSSFTMLDGMFEFTVSANASNPESDPYAGTRTVRNNASGEIQLFGDGEFTVPGTYVYSVSEADNSVAGITYDDAAYVVTVTVTDNTAGQLESHVSVAKPDGAAADRIVFMNKYQPEVANAMIQARKVLEGKDLEAGMFEFKLNYQGMDPVDDDRAEAEESEPADEDTADSSKTDSEGQEADNTGTDEEAGSEEEKTDASDSEEQNGESDSSEESEAADAEAGIALMNLDDEEENADPENEISAQTDEDETDGNVTEEGNTEHDQTEGEGNTSNTEGDANVEEEEPESKKEADSEKDPADIIPAELTAANDAAGLISFGNITFMNSGDYHFTISEVNNGLRGVTYDETVHSVTVKVRHDQENGKLVISSIEGAGTDLSVFTNTYKPDPVSLVGAAAVQAQKVLNGRELAEGEFSFELLNQQGEVAATAVNTADGWISFEPVGDMLTFTEPGTYTFSMVEVPGDKGGIAYDLESKPVTVTVVDAGGYLTAETSIENPVFTNSYATAPASVTPKVFKKLEGTDLHANQFTFNLTGEDGSWIQSQLNAEDGSVVFDPILYDAPGTYIYKISEENDGNSQIEYDDKVITLTVEVVDDNEGNLVVEESYDQDQTFVNKFTKKPDGKPAPTPTPTPTPAPTPEPTPVKKLEEAPTGVKLGLAASSTTAALSLAGIVILLKKRKNFKK